MAQNRALRPEENKVVKGQHVVFHGRSEGFRGTSVKGAGWHILVRTETLRLLDIYPRNFMFQTDYPHQNALALP
ncbi:MAG: hypothetical protein ACRDUW_02055 [Pseudonocardiaceae bacterium]